MRRPAAPPQIAFSEFIQRVESGAVTQVTFGERALEVKFRDESRCDDHRAGRVRRGQSPPS